MACQFVQDRAAYKLQETVLFFVLPQLFLELRREQIEQLGVPRDERRCCVRGTKDDDISWSAHNDVATKATFYLAHIRTLLDVLGSERVQRRSGPMASKRAHP